VNSDRRGWGKKDQKMEVGGVGDCILTELELVNLGGWVCWSEDT